jgi:membrane fusion protein (multidrug efflux system)
MVVFDCAIEHAQVARARSVAAQAEKTFAINQRLLALKSIGQLELEVSEAEVGKAAAELAAAAATASKCTISAPFSGVTVNQKAREYQYATPAQPLLEILDDHSPYNAPGGRVDPVSQSIEVFAELAGNVTELMAGMSGRAELLPPK